MTQFDQQYQILIFLMEKYLYQDILKLYGLFKVIFTWYLDQLILQKFQMSLLV